MELVYDYMLPYRGYHTAGGLCRARLYYPQSGEDAPPAIAILSELPDNRNTSITNLCETLFCELSLDRALPEGTWFVEHYPRDETRRRAGFSEEEIDLVSFGPLRGSPAGEVAGLPYLLTPIGGVSRPTFGTPDWDPLERNQLEWNIGGEFEWEPAPEKPASYSARIEDERLRRGDEHRAREAIEEASLPERPEIQPAFAEGSEYLVIRRVEDPESPGSSVLETNVARSVVQHSPAGFEIGYGGSGPADLALNVLSALLPPDEDNEQPVRCFRGECSHTAWMLHQSFKEDFLVGMDANGESIPAGVIRDWLKVHTDKEETT